MNELRTRPMPYTADYVYRVPEAGADRCIASALAADRRISLRHAAAGVFFANLALWAAIAALYS